MSRKSKQSEEVTLTTVKVLRTRPTDLVRRLNVWLRNSNCRLQGIHATEVSETAVPYTVGVMRMSTIGGQLEDYIKTSPEPEHNIPDIGHCSGENLERKHHPHDRHASNGGVRETTPQYLLAL